MEDLYYKPFERYNPMALDKFSRTIPEIHFSEYFAAFTPRSFPDRVIVTYPEYYKSLTKILEETSAEVVEAYLVTRAALTLSPYLSPTTKSWRAQRSLEETLNGIKKGAVGERWETCVHVVEEQLGFAVGRYFVNETFAGDSQAKGTKVITNIVATFKESLKNLKWMDEKSAAAATKKADNIKVKVGFPLSPDTRDARSIANYYSKVEIKKDYYFENFVSASVNAASIEWMKLGRRRNPESWEMYPSMVNAYFSPDGNQIVFPAGILQPPFFSQDWPSYLSYGAFGMVAAHELTHAFDSLGRLYNQDAKLERWWTNATSEAFMERQKCIVDQYSKYTVEGPNGEKVHVNGNLTSSENIGDSGVIQAYRAWKAQLHASYRDGGEFLLPGLNYTREQMFFIGFARAWANNARPESAVQLIRVDPHSPTRWRVDGTLSNVPEFAEAFQCKKGAKLNPPDKERCIFW
jgi:endothelin-converting enzyme